MKSIFLIYSRLFPKRMAQRIFNFLSNPQIHKPRDFEDIILEQSNSDRFEFKQYEIQRYQWGDSKHPVALLVHGWEGQAGNFGKIVPVLLEKGFHVVGFDGPAHGRSSRQPTNMFDHAELVIKMIGEYTPDLVITHSFGTVTTSFGLLHNPDFELKQWISITTPFNYLEFLHRMQDRFGIGERAFDHLVDLIESSTGHKVTEMNMQTMGSKAKVNSFTLYHSIDDKVIPVEDSERTSKYMPNAKLVKMNGLGHYRILWSDELIEQLKGEIDPAAAPASLRA